MSVVDPGMRANYEARAAEYDVRDLIGAQERVLDYGTRHSVYKRFFAPEGLAEELGGGAPTFAGTYFVAVRVDLR